MLDGCIRAGEELGSQAEIAEKWGGHGDWIHLFARWKERTIADLREVYDGDDVPSEFEFTTRTIERSSPRLTFPGAKSDLDLGLWKLHQLVERLPLSCEPQALRRDIPSAPSPDRQSPYETRPTAELVTSAEDHFLEHKQTLRYDVHTKQVNPKGMRSIYLDDSGRSL